MNGPAPASPMVDMALGRIVIREHSDSQYIYLRERGGKRGFPIVIGSAEAAEIRRVVARIDTERPLTHQLLHEVLKSLDTKLAHVDIVDLRNNTFFAQLVLHDRTGEIIAALDARPSDAIAIALRAKAPIRVAESVLEQVRTDESADPLPEEPPEDPSDSDE